MGTVALRENSVAAVETIGGRETPRRVGLLLGFGIVLMPYLFAWFLLRRGYRPAARTLAFGWLALSLIAVALTGGPSGASGGSASGDPRTLTQTITDAAVDPQLNAISDKVARDSVEQYEMSRKSGDKMEICVRAGLVAAAYNQAKNQAMYLHWKQNERDDCQEAGITQH